MEKIVRDNDYLIEETDRAIAQLVVEKTPLFKAYNYYSGIRDKKQFQHLEENYGIGTPTNVTFTPLIRKHIQALVGEFLTLPIKPKISCKDESTINNIYREKLLKIQKAIVDVIKPKMQNLIYSLIKGDGKNKIDDALFSLQLKNAQEEVENNFISEYEIAAQDIVQYILLSRDIDYKNKLEDLILDLFIGGEAYYRVIPTSGKNNIDIQVLNPINVFPDRNVNSPYINDSYRIVYRSWLSKPELMIKYGSELKKKDIDNLNKFNFNSYDNHMVPILIGGKCGLYDVDGLYAGVGTTTEYTDEYFSRTDLYCVYEVEWIDYEFEGKKRIEKRYKTTRIGGDIYILHGEDKDSVRSINSPNECKLSINGILHIVRTGRPYSLMLATADLQDKYDIALFYKNNIIASSGTVGDWVDVAHLPDFLGDDAQEKLIKWMAYKKSGIAIMNSAQEGLPLNTTFNGFDDTLRLQAIQAVDLVIQDLENTAMSITGVFRERLGGIQQRDAVLNVEVGMQLSYIITKLYFQTMDTIIRETLLDSLNLAKKVFKHGISGTLILGESKKRIFTALPEHYAFTDHDVHILDSQEVLKEKEQIKLLTAELVRGGLVDPDILIAVSTSESLTLMKIEVNKAIARKKEEASQMAQAQQQMQQMEQLLKEMQKQLLQAAKLVDQYKQEQLNIEKQRLKQDFELGNLKLKNEKEFNEDKLAVEKQKAQIEFAQLFDDNKRNDGIKYSNDD